MSDDTTKSKASPGPMNRKVVHRVAALLVCMPAFAADLPPGFKPTDKGPPEPEHCDWSNKLANCSASIEEDGQTMNAPHCSLFTIAYSGTDPVLIDAWKTPWRIYYTGKPLRLKPEVVGLIRVTACEVFKDKKHKTPDKWFRK